ncbi:MAG: N-acetylglucosamine kinase [Chloroflexi bacterium]|nr:N-acetylglucosamine kinase [Chloroflexota bacterium]
MSGLIIGVDGGQTSTRAALADLNGNVVGEGCGGGLIHLAAEGGRERFASALRTALAEAWRAASLAPQPVDAIALGLSGVDGGTAEAVAVREMLPALLEARVVVVENDGVAALYGAHAGQPGVIVISGTGTIAWGMDSRGELACVSGWGWLLGDAGSACTIGRDGLIAALAAYDKAGPATSLVERFLREFAVPDLYDAKRMVYAPDFGARGFAALAPVVSGAAEAGDAVARRVIADAGHALAASALAVINRLQFDDMPVHVAPVGGAFEHVFGLRAVFAGDVCGFEAVRAVVVEPQRSPVIGAVIMARHVLNKQ